jgi:polysaccharide export outer membrane protein
MIVVAAVLHSGCQTTSRTPPVVEVGDEVTPGEECVLEPGDVLEIRFFNASELDVTQPIRPDGKIALQFINEYDARGKTPAEIQKELVERYSSIIAKPDISVIVRTYNSRCVFVMGEVRNPGRIDMPGTLTALGAIVRAGGFTEVAKGSRVAVFREISEKRYRFPVNISKALKAVDIQDPFYLKPGDIVYVPRF